MIGILLSTIPDADDSAFMSKVYRDFKNLMFFTVKKYAHKQEDCEDIVQDGLEKLIKQIPRLRAMERDCLIGYIVVAMRHTTANYLEKEAYREALIQTLGEEYESSAPQITLDEYLAQKELLESLEQVWPHISREDQFLLEGKYILGYSDREMADELACGANSIRMKLTRARRHTLARLQENEVSYDPQRTVTRTI